MDLRLVIVHTTTRPFPSIHGTVEERGKKMEERGKKEERDELKNDRKEKSVKINPKTHTKTDTFGLFEK